MADYSTILTNLQSAAEAISSQIASGRATVKWSVGSETYESEKPTEALDRILDAIAKIERRTNRSTRLLRVAKLGRAQASGG